MVNNQIKKSVLLFARYYLAAIMISVSLFMSACQEAYPLPSKTDYVPVVVADKLTAKPAYPGEPLSTTAPPAAPSPIPTTILEIEQASSNDSDSPANLTIEPPAVPSPTQTAMTPEISPSAAAPELIQTPVVSPTLETPPIFSIGQSVQGRPINAYQFNNGPRKIIVIGGIHGGYEWNTILLAYALIDYFQATPGAVPDSVSLTIIPSANPDGQMLVTGKEGRFAEADVAENSAPGRFNANEVDLNRNWDCQWEPEATWRNQQVSGGSEPFSEPESVALRDYLLAQQPEAVIFLHSAANGVFAAGCPQTDLNSMLLAQAYGEATNYPVYERFTSYPITGDAGDWLTMQGITTITIELFDHQSIEWTRNLSGMLAVLDYYR